MGNYKVDGIVLKARNFGEADRILTVLDRELGKLEAVAKGARRAQSTLRGPCQPFSHDRFFLWHGRTLDGISQAEAVESFAALRDDLVKLAAASYMAELVDSVLHERDSSPETFDLLLDHFRWLDTIEPAAANIHHVLRAFDLRLLGLAGFAPALDACASCGAPVEEWMGTASGGRGAAGTAAGGAVAFSAAAGGIVCPACRAAAVGWGGGEAAGEGSWAEGGGESPEGAGQAEGLGLPGVPVVLIAAGTLAAMRHLARAATTAQARILRLTPRAAAEMEQALRGHISYHLDRRLKSLDFLDQVLK